MMVKRQGTATCFSVPEKMGSCFCRDIVLVSKSGLIET